MTDHSLSSSGSRSVSPTDTTPVAGVRRTDLKGGSTTLRAFAAEVVGTCVLMIVGPGSAILAADAMGALGVALAFGLALLAMAYTIGHVSGCHINPAVTLSFLLARKLTLVQAGYYWAGQLVGAVLGGFIVYVISERGDLDNTVDADGQQIFAANGWGPDIGSSFGIGSAIAVEIVFTALLVFVVLATTGGGYLVGFGGLAAGLTLAMIHLATIPVDNTSVNPARSIGTAIFSGGDALAQLWVFIVFPLVGALLGVFIWLLVHEEQLEDTMFGRHRSILAARDRATGFAGRLDNS